jgi:hypothetical protein
MNKDSIFYLNDGPFLTMGWWEAAACSLPGRVERPLKRSE